MSNFINSVFSKLTLLKISQLCLCGTSVACTVLLLVSLATDQVSMVLAGLTGIGLQLCMYLFPAYAAEYWATIDSKWKKPKRMHSCFCWLGSLVLFLVSVIASTTFLDNSVRQTRHEVYQEQNAANSNSDLIKSKKSQIAAIERQINVLTRVTEKDTDGDYRKRAIGTMRQINELNDKLSAHLNELSLLMNSDVDYEAQKSLPWYYQSEQGRWMLFFILAVLIDACGIATILLIKEEKSKGDIDEFLNAASEFQEPLQSDIAECTEFEPLESSPLSSLETPSFASHESDDLSPPPMVMVSKEQFNDTQRSVYEKLKNRMYDKPVMSQIMKEFKGVLKQHEVRDVFNLLHHEGVITYQNAARKSYVFC